MAANNHELELKFALPGAAVFDVLERLPNLGPFVIRPRKSPELQENRYFDTPSKHLRNGRHGFRVRLIGTSEKKRQAIATLKGPTTLIRGAQSRTEFEQPFKGECPEDIPEGLLLQNLRELTQGEKLEPTLVIKTKRHLFDVLRGSVKIVEMAYDQSEIMAGGRKASFRELELELLEDGKPDDLDTLAALLRERVALDPETRPKLERGLALLDVAAPSSERLQQIACALFDNVQAQYDLPERFRPVLCTAVAALCTAEDAQLPKAEQVARDSILESSLAVLSLNDTQRVQAACVVALQSNKLRPEREPCFIRFGERGQQRMLRLAAILQLAQALSQASTLRLAFTEESQGLLLTMDGPEMQAFLQKIQKAAERWISAIGPLTIEAQPLSDAYTLPVSDIVQHSLIQTELNGLSDAAESARRILRQMFERLLAREEDVRSGNDDEDVHQMRVATRRLRATLQIVSYAFDQKILRSFRRDLRHMAASLGELRDIDVFLESLRDAEIGADLHVLREAAEQAHDQARAELLKDLDGDVYCNFRRAFASFLTSPGTALAALPETGQPPRIRDVAGSALWRRYEELRAFEIYVGNHTPENHEKLHQARIAGKAFRYTMEFFRPALGQRSDDLLERLAALQELLGHLQDVVAARQRISTLGMLDDPGAQRYLEYIEQRSAKLEGDIPYIWDRAAGATMRRQLFEMILKL